MGLARTQAFRRDAVHEFLGMSEKALALAMEGRAREARAIIEEPRRSSIATTPNWVNQAWGLVGADVLALSGETQRALKHARRSTSGSFETLLVEDYAGQFARWTALIAAHDESEQAGLQSIVRLLERLEEFDAKDQGEILVAYAYLVRRLGQTPSVSKEAFASKIGILPAQTRLLLKRTGFSGELSLHES